MSNVTLYMTLQLYLNLDDKTIQGPQENVVKLLRMNGENIVIMLYLPVLIYLLYPLSEQQIATHPVHQNFEHPITKF